MENKPFPKDGLVRVSQIIAPNGPIPVSKAKWWEGVKNGEFPQGIKLTKGITAWRAVDIRALYEPAEAAA